MYSFAKRPRWLVSHAMVLALVVFMVILGLWQLQRLDDRKATNQLLEAQLELQARDYETAVTQSIGKTPPRFTPVSISGQYEPGAVLVANRTLDGAPGFWALQLVNLDTGGRAVVIRGFATRGSVENGLDQLEAAGSVDETGFVEHSSADGLIANRVDDPPRINRIAPNVLTEIFGGDFDPIYVVLDEPDSLGLLPVERPEITNGPHLGYAAQWFIFATIAGLGYLLILRRTATGPNHDDDDEPALL